MKEKLSVFVAHAYTHEQRDDLRSAIEKAFEDSPYKALYADQKVRTETDIFQKINDMIAESEFGIFDISTDNSNVYIELGIAIGKGKTAYVICRENTVIPSDLLGYDRIHYPSYKELVHVLKKKIFATGNQTTRTDKEEEGHDKNIYT